ncbi:hypothetical protein JXM67_05165 [candidate division WOR-3 bacterium]|nr:hypothetical protein [candidate division WOR-3 bacterium]
MTQENITGDHIISSLKTLGFSESSEKAEAENSINLRLGEHKISVSKGTLNSEETTRIRTELSPIFKTLNKKVEASSDETVLSVRDWLTSSSSE